ncbi:MAG: PIG-L deacetylase family protein, partial [Dehalococcoidia bacterium]
MASGSGRVNDVTTDAATDTANTANFNEAAPPEPKRALGIFAHPDDAEFLCGGTVAKLCAEGWDVRYIIATSGDKGTKDLTMTPSKLAEMREAEQTAAGCALGVKECIYLRYPDGFLESDAELRGRLVRLIRRYRPDTVITWDGFRPGFNHRDHR